MKVLHSSMGYSLYTSGWVPAFSKPSASKLLFLSSTTLKQWECVLENVSLEIMMFSCLGRQVLNEEAKSSASPARKIGPSTTAWGREKKKSIFAIFFLSHYIFHRGGKKRKHQITM